MLAKFGAVVVVLAVSFVGALEAQTVSVRKLWFCSTNFQLVGAIGAEV